MSNPCYFSALIDPYNKLIPRKDKADQVLLNHLRDNNFRAARFEKKHTQNIYSLRFNRGARLVCAVYTQGGQDYLVVLQRFTEAEHDRYERYLQHQANRDFKAVKATFDANGLEGLSQYSLEPEVLEEEERVMLAAAEVYWDEEVQWDELRFHGEQVVRLSDQQQVAMNSPLPCLFEGTGGSGKTLLIIQRLLELAQQQFENCDQGLIESIKPLLYVGPTHLIHEVRMLWKQTAALHDVDPKLVQFASPNSVVDQLFKQHGFPRKVAGFDDFQAWYAGYLTSGQGKKLLRDAVINPQEQAKPSQRKRKGKKAKAPKTSTQKSLGSASKSVFSVFNDAQKVYCEMMMFATLGSNDYKETGQRQSRLEGKEKELLMSVHDQYKQYCSGQSDESWFDPSIHQFDLCKLAPDLSANIKNMYAGIFVDEAHDAPRCLDSFFKFLATGQIGFALDINQATFGAVTAANLLKQQLFPGQSSSDQHVKLAGSFRTSKRIGKLINRLLLVKNFLLGGVSEEGQDTVFTVNRDVEGSVRWLEIAEEKLDFSRENNTAIIVFNEKDREIVEKVYPEQLVLLAKEAQGLEFDHIVLYRFIEQMRSIPEDILKKVDESLKSSELTSVSSNLSKDRRAAFECEDALLELNEFFIALSRSRNNLTFLDNKPSKKQTRFHSLVKRLFGQVSKEKLEVALVTSEAGVATETEEMPDEKAILFQAEIDSVLARKEKNEAKLEIIRQDILSNNSNREVRACKRYSKWKMHVFTSLEYPEYKKQVQEEAKSDELFSDFKQAGPVRYSRKNEEKLEPSLIDKKIGGEKKELESKKGLTAEEKREKKIKYVKEIFNRALIFGLQASLGRNSFDVLNRDLLNFFKSKRMSNFLFNIPINQAHQCFFEAMMGDLNGTFENILKQIRLIFKYDWEVDGKDRSDKPVDNRLMLINILRNIKKLLSRPELWEIVERFPENSQERKTFNENVVAWLQIDIQSRIPDGFFDEQENEELKNIYEWLLGMCALHGCLADKYEPSSYSRAINHFVKSGIPEARYQLAMLRWSGLMVQQKVFHALSMLWDIKEDFSPAKEFIRKNAPMYRPEIEKELGYNFEVCVTEYANSGNKLYEHYLNSQREEKYLFAAAMKNQISAIIGVIENLVGQELFHLAIFWFSHLFQIVKNTKKLLPHRPDDSFDILPQDVFRAIGPIKEKFPGGKKIYLRWVRKFQKEFGFELDSQQTNEELDITDDFINELLINYKECMNELKPKSNSSDKTKEETQNFIHSLEPYALSGSSKAQLALLEGLNVLENEELLEFFYFQLASVTLPESGDDVEAIKKWEIYSKENITGASFLEEINKTLFLGFKKMMGFDSAPRDVKAGVCLLKKVSVLLRENLGCFSEEVIKRANLSSSFICLSDAAQLIAPGAKNQEKSAIKSKTSAVVNENDESIVDGSTVDGFFILEHFCRIFDFHFQFGLREFEERYQEGFFVSLSCICKSEDDFSGDSSFRFQLLSLQDAFHIVGFNPQITWDDEDLKTAELSFCIPPGVGKTTSKRAFKMVLRLYTMLLPCYESSEVAPYNAVAISQPSESLLALWRCCAEFDGWVPEGAVSAPSQFESKKFSVGKSLESRTTNVSFVGGRNFSGVKGVLFLGALDRKKHPIVFLNRDRLDRSVILSKDFMNKFYGSDKGEVNGLDDSVFISNFNSLEHQKASDEVLANLELLMNAFKQAGDVYDENNKIFNEFDVAARAIGLITADQSIIESLFLIFEKNPFFKLSAIVSLENFVHDIVSVGFNNAFKGMMSEGESASRKSLAAASILSSSLGGSSSMYSKQTTRPPAPNETPIVGTLTTNFVAKK